MVGLDTDRRLDLVVEHLAQVHRVHAETVQPRDRQSERLIEIETDFGPVRACLTTSAPGHLLVFRPDGSTWRFTRWSSWDAQAAARVLGLLVPEIRIRRGQECVVGQVTLQRAAEDGSALSDPARHVWSFDLPEPHLTAWSDRVREVARAADTPDPLAPEVSFWCPFPIEPDLDGRQLDFMLDVLSTWIGSGNLIMMKES
jgi:hypothetical protein